MMKHLIYGLILAYWSMCVSVSSEVPYFPSDKIDIPASIQMYELPDYANVLSLMEESPLWPLSKTYEYTSFRFTYLRSRDEPVTFILNVYPNDNKWVLTAKQANSPLAKVFKIEVNKKIVLSVEEANQFRELFDSIRFWELPSVGALETEYSLFDGSVWLFEAVEKGRYHFLRRLSPKETGNVWISDPSTQKEFKKMREEEGYPFIDRETNSRVNEKLVALGEFFMKLSGLKLSSVY